MAAGRTEIPMNNSKLIALVVGLALLAGFGGSLLKDGLQPQDAQAQAVRQEKAIRIALINLEEAARRSPAFADRKVRWDQVRLELERDRARLEEQLRDKTRQLRERRAEGSPEDLLTEMAAEVEALKQAAEASESEHRKYLATLLSQYQKEVLLTVIPEIKRYALAQHYDIVLQDYTEDAASGLFDADAYAQTLINKPVLFVPRITSNQNPYVTDITQAIIQRMGSIAPPPPEQADDPPPDSSND